MKWIFSTTSILLFCTMFAHSMEIETYDDICPRQMGSFALDSHTNKAKPPTAQKYPEDRPINGSALSLASPVSADFSSSITTCKHFLALDDVETTAWTDAFVEVIVDGVSLGVYGNIPSTVIGGYELFLEEGAVVEFIHTNGSNPDEEFFEFFDPLENIVAELDFGSPLYQVYTVACAGPSCTDMIQNADESGIDCGGSNCVPCPTCMDGDTILLFEDFDGCTMPAGWTATTSDGGVNAVSFEKTVAYMVVGSGSDPSPEFSGCLVIFDDLSENDLGIGCVISPVIDMSAFINGSLVFDWQSLDNRFDQGDFYVEVFDGFEWIQVFLVQEDGSGTNELIDLSAFTNANFQVRFCYDDEGEFAVAAAFDNVGICGGEAVLNCPAALTTADITGSYCDGSEGKVSATSNTNVTYAWTSSNPNVVIVNPSSATSSVSMLAPVPCQIETANISLSATCNLDGTELFNGLVSTVSVYPAPPADITTLVQFDESTCDEPILVDPNCAAFITLTPDVASGTAAYTITYASPAGAPDCCPPMTGGDRDIILDGDFESGGPGNGWSTFSTGISPVIRPRHPLNGLYGVWLGAIAPGNSNVRQTVSIPSTAVAADLSFNIAADECYCAGGDDMEVLINDVVVWSLCNPLASQVNSEATICNYQTDSDGPIINVGPLDVSGFADGNPYVLGFYCYESGTVDDALVTSIFIDDVVLFVTEPVANVCEATILCNECVDNLNYTSNPVIDEDLAAQIKITTNGKTVANTTINYHAGVCLEFTSGFEVVSSTVFHAYIAPCD